MKERKATVAYGIVYLAYNECCPAFAEELQNDFQRYMIRLRGSVATDEEVNLAFPVEQERFEMRINLLRYIQCPAPPSL